MSKYSELRTLLTNERLLVDTLDGLGYSPVCVSGGTSLVGYMGDERTEQATIIIRRNQLNSASNDIGFTRGPDGTFRAIISDYDRSIGFDDAWLSRLAQAYKERQTMSVANAKGYVFKGREVVQTPQGKTVRLRFAVR